METANMLYHIVGNGSLEEVLKMKSIKPGRGPSGISFVGSVIAVIFGVLWTIVAASITANLPYRIIGVIFPLFGVLFVIMGIVQAVYNYKNATGKDRYSLLDITDSNEEGDPSDRWIKDNIDNEIIEQQENLNIDFNYCPYCGAQIMDEYVYCPKCGKGIK